MSKANPCLYCNWNHNDLTIWLSWINYDLLMGNKKGIEIQQTVQNIHEGEMKKYIGCKIVLLGREIIKDDTNSTYATF